MLSKLAAALVALTLLASCGNPSGLGTSHDQMAEAADAAVADALPSALEAQAKADTRVEELQTQTKDLADKLDKAESDIRDLVSKNESLSTSLQDLTDSHNKFVDEYNRHLRVYHGHYQ